MTDTTIKRLDDGRLVAEWVVGDTLWASYVHAGINKFNDIGEVLTLSFAASVVKDEEPKEELHIIQFSCAMFAELIRQLVSASGESEAFCLAASAAIAKALKHRGTS